VIATDRQLVRARAELEQLREALRSEQRDSHDQVTPELAAAAVAGIQAQIDELEAQIAQFEDLWAGRVKRVHVASLLDIPNVLIAARLAAGLTQAELAKRIGVSQQQVQKDEAGDYARASLDRLHAVAALLEVSLEGEARLPGPGTLVAVPSQDALIRGERARAGGAGHNGVGRKLG
jgi:HTH-type transcriptional regulator/antitoxin HigA